MAAPCVSGLVGLMKSIQPELTTDQVYSILSETGGRSGDPGSTGPVIHAGRAIDRLLSLYPPAN
jgi:thermitase